MSTKKLQILGSLSNSDADTLDGKHASDFASASDVTALEELVGDKKVSDQIAASLTEANSYTDASIEGISEGFGNVIYQMYGNDLTEESAPTIRQIASDEVNTALDSAKEYTDTVASGKADASHSHNNLYYTKTEIDESLLRKSQVQIITWGVDD